MFLGKQALVYLRQRLADLVSVAAGLLQLSVLKSRKLSAAYWKQRGEQQQNNSTSRVAIKTSSTEDEREERLLF